MQRVERDDPPEPVLPQPINCLVRPEHADVVQQGVERPSCPKIFLIPIAPTNGGRTIGASNNAVSTFLPANSKRSPSQASGIDSANAAAVLPTASRNALRNPSM